MKPSAYSSDMSKRLLDILVSVLILLLSLPTLVVCGLILKICSPGPAIFRSHRVGKDGGLFIMHKLRTMHVHDPGDGPVITAPGDTRIFGFGRFLRATKIDELPQLYDVLRGKMSVVGPRPEAPEIVEQYYSDRHRQSLHVKPGLTSPAALLFSVIADDRLTSGNVIEDYTDRILDEKLEQEIAYIERATIWSDINIVARSLLYVARATLGFFARPAMGRQGP